MNAYSVTHNLDGTSYELLIGLLCRSGRLIVAYSLLATYTAEISPKNQDDRINNTSPLENAALYLAFAQACALRGLREECRRCFVYCY